MGVHNILGESSGFLPTGERCQVMATCSGDSMHPNSRSSELAGVISLAIQPSNITNEETGALNTCDLPRVTE